MASCLLNAVDGTVSSIYGEYVNGFGIFANNNLTVGQGGQLNKTTVYQTNVSEFQGGVQVSKLVGQVDTGLIQADGLTIRQKGLAAPSIGLNAFPTGSGGVVTITTAASDTLALIFALGQAEYNVPVPPNPPVVIAPAAAGILTISAKTSNGFTITSSAGAADEGKVFAWWIVNPSYS